MPILPLRDVGSGRPTKRERRDTDRLRGRGLRTRTEQRLCANLFRVRAVGRNRVTLQPLRKRSNSPKTL